MKKEIALKVHAIDFPEDIMVPEETNDYIFIPCWGQDFTHHYFLMDFREKKIHVFEVDLAEEVKVFRENMIKYHKNETSPHRMTFDQLTFWMSCPHQGEYHDGKIIVSFTFFNCFVLLELNQLKAYLIYDENCSHDWIYASTNQIVDGKMYTSRWKFEDMYKANPNIRKPIDLELLEYDISTDQFIPIDSIKASDQIHATNITPDNRYLIMIEMNIDPKIHSANIEEEEEEKKIKICQKGLVDSDCYVYDLKNKSFTKETLANCPAHLVFDDEEPGIIYFSLHNLGLCGPNMYSFGAAGILKYQLNGNGTLELLEKLKDEDIVRIPGHTLYKYQGKKYIVSPITPNQTLIVNCKSMKIERKIPLRKKIKKADFSKGPMMLKIMTLDRTPYSAQVKNETPYLYLSNILSIGIFNISTDKYECNFRFNPGFPIIGGGHSTKFETVNMQSMKSTAFEAMNDDED